MSAFLIAVVELAERFTYYVRDILIPPYLI